MYATGADKQDTRAASVAVQLPRAVMQTKSSFPCRWFISRLSVQETGKEGIEAGEVERESIPEDPSVFVGGRSSGVETFWYLYFIYGFERYGICGGGGGANVRLQLANNCSEVVLFSVVSVCGCVLVCL